MSRTAASRSTTRSTAAPSGRPEGAVARREGEGRTPGSRPMPTLSGELRGSALLFALAITVTAGAAAAARLLAGLAP
jgi:hypothetical protein